MKFKFPDESQGFAERQVTQITKDSEFYSAISNSEYHLISEYIDQPKTILELGCGLGRMSVYMNWMLQDTDIHYILADSTCDVFPAKVKYGWNPASGFYNDLAVTESFCKLNGLTNFEILDLQYGSLNAFSDISLVMSFLSVGFHYPIDMYLETLMDITSDDAVMIFGIRKGQYDVNDFNDKFSMVTISEQKNIDTREDILIVRK